MPEIASANASCGRARGELASEGVQREYGLTLRRVCDLLGACGLAPPEGTRFDLRRPALIAGGQSGAPVVMMRCEIDEQSGEVPAEVATLAAALAQSQNIDSLNLRVVCMPSHWEENSYLLRQSYAAADVELTIALDPGDLGAAEEARRPLRLRLGPEPIHRRLARWLERHPFFYSLAVLAEFSLKHPLFGQILCGGPCGISSAWQFMCTMGKTFMSKRDIDDNLLTRPVFERMRADPRPIVRLLWPLWERCLRLALWPAIGLRRLIVRLARLMPAWWTLAARGALRTGLTFFINELECPKSLRNGACGAPTNEGKCGELLKYGISKPCIFYVRNARDRSGMKLAERLARRASSLEKLPLPAVGRPLAVALRVLAAIVARRPLSNQIYPRVDETVPGASAIVSAMAGHYHGARIFGSTAYLPPLLSRSTMVLAGLTPRGQNLAVAARLAFARRRLRVSDRAEVLARILDALCRKARAEAGSLQPPAARQPTYERMLTAQASPSPALGRSETQRQT